MAERYLQISVVCITGQNKKQIASPDAAWTLFRFYDCYKSFCCLLYLPFRFLCVNTCHMVLHCNFYEK